MPAQYASCACTYTALALLLVGSYITNKMASSSDKAPCSSQKQEARARSRSRTPPPSPSSDASQATASKPQPDPAGDPYLDLTSSDLSDQELAAALTSSFGPAAAAKPPPPPPPPPLPAPPEQPLRPVPFPSFLQNPNLPYPQLHTLQLHLPIPPPPRQPPPPDQPWGECWLPAPVTLPQPRFVGPPLHPRPRPKPKIVLPPKPRGSHPKYPVNKPAAATATVPSQSAVRQKARPLSAQQHL